MLYEDETIHLTANESILYKNVAQSFAASH